MGVVLAWDRGRRIRPLALQSPEAERLLPGMDADVRLASFHLVGAGETVLSGGEALPPLFRQLPGGAPIAAVLGAAQPLTNLLYGLIAANRTRIGPRIPAGWRARADERIRRRGTDAA